MGGREKGGVKGAFTHLRQGPCQTSCHSSVVPPSWLSSRSVSRRAIATSRAPTAWPAPPLERASQMEACWRSSVASCSKGVEGGAGKWVPHSGKQGCAWHARGAAERAADCNTSWIGCSTVH